MDNRTIWLDLQVPSGDLKADIKPSVSCDIHAGGQSVRLSFMDAILLLCFDGRLPDQAWCLDVTIHLESSAKNEHNSVNFLGSFISNACCHAPCVMRKPWKQTVCPGFFSLAVNTDSGTMR